MPDHIYVVAGAIRIQAWISRTPRLRLSRGASRALATRTGATFIDAALATSPVEAIRATEAADIDGVVVLRLEPSDDETHQVQATVSWLRRQLATSLPAVEWQVWAQRASTYVAAQQVANGGGPVSHERWRFLPTDGELPLAEACGGCGAESAVATREMPEGSLRLGPDCIVRLDHTKGLDDDRAWQFETLAEKGGVGTGPSTSMVVGRRDAANHLATVAADGNRVGALFTSLSTVPARNYDFDGRTTTIQERISKQLAAATKNAVHEASLVGESGAGLRCAIDHLIGGDDVLVSVAARFAWTYVTTLVREFESLFQQAMDEVLSHALAAGGIDQRTDDQLRELAADVSISVGIVFANRKHPFAHCAERAHSVLSAAKRSGRGSAAVSWLDLTVEDRLPAGRSVSPRELDLPLVTPAGATARATLAGLIRDKRRAINQASSAAGTARSESETAELMTSELLTVVQNWSRRTQTDQLLSAGATAHDLRQLENDLDRARWWPLSERTGA